MEEGLFQYDFLIQGQTIVLKIMHEGNNKISYYKLLDLPDQLLSVNIAKFKQNCKIEDINLKQKCLYLHDNKIHIEQYEYQQIKDKDKAKGKKMKNKDTLSTKSTKQSSNKQSATKQEEEQVKIQQEIKKKKRARKNRKKPKYTEDQNQEDEKPKKKKGKKKRKTKLISKSKKGKLDKNQKNTKKSTNKNKKVKAKEDKNEIKKQQDEVKKQENLSKNKKKSKQKDSKSKSKGKDQNKSQDKQNKSKKNKSKNQQGQKIKIQDREYEENIKIEQMQNIEPLSDDDERQNEKKVEQKQKKKLSKEQRLKQKQDNQRRIDEKLKKFRNQRTQRKVIEELQRQAKKDKLFFSKYGANFTIKIDSNCKHYDQYKIGKGQIEKKGKLYCQIYNQAPIPVQGRHYFAFKIIRLTFRSVTVGLITPSNFQEQYSRDKKNCICFDAYTHSTYIQGQKTEILYQIKINDVVRTVVDIPSKSVIWYVNNEQIGDAIIPEDMINQPLYPYIQMSNKWIKIRFDEVQE